LPKRQRGNDQLISLQHDILTAVNSPVAIQSEILQIKPPKFDMQKVMTDMKRAELFAKGMWKDENKAGECNAVARVSKGQ